jgi:sensor c-di-GMP phosphodiesterase-like protein
MHKQHDPWFLQGKKYFKFIWWLITIAILLIMLSYNWRHNQQIMQQALQIRAQETQDGVEKLFDNLLRTIYSLPIYGEHFDCPSKLLPALQQATFDNSKISGLAISDNKNRTICSTLPASYALFTKINKARNLLGPLTIEPDQPSFFLLQQPLGDYYVTVYFLQTVLEESLLPYLAPNDYVVLYNQNNHEKLAEITAKHYQNPESFTGPFATSKLLALDNVSVMVGSNLRQLQRSFITSSLAIILILIGFSFLLYYFIWQLINKRFSLQCHLKFAVKNKHFFPVYQPIYNNKLKRFHGAEVLLRWQTVNGDIIMPETFIAEAEKTELIVAITLQIADIALDAYSTILKPAQPFYLTFNVSAHHFTSDSFFDDFILLVKKHQLNPQQIMLELTERDIINKNDRVFHKKMQYLRKLGFLLAIDDFGTGHANISYLQHFPFNYLKIDRLFVQAIGTGSVTELLIDTIITMAKTLQLTIIAEGIEEREQVLYLEANDVQYLQGWYYAKAMTITELRQLL